MTEPQDNPFEWVSGRPYFHGLPVFQRKVDVAGNAYLVAALKDAADLLDLPEFEERFIKQDIAPYGLELWPAAVMLSEHIADPNRTIVDQFPQLARDAGFVVEVSSARATMDDGPEVAGRIFVLRR